ncbi:MAG: hypothetical protein LBO02_03040 [Holosporaceae bacterium]|jgi:hypothetical protein|nr:hypothetical protein [Holosporaceae bacterium]
MKKIIFLLFTININLFGMIQDKMRETLDNLGPTHSKVTERLKQAMDDHPDRFSAVRAQANIFVRRAPTIKNREVEDFLRMLNRDFPLITSHKPAPVSYAETPVSKTTESPAPTTLPIEEEESRPQDVIVDYIDEDMYKYYMELDENTLSDVIGRAIDFLGEPNTNAAAKNIPQKDRLSFTNDLLDSTREGQANTLVILRIFGFN